tara:strand:- start:628 stop:1734 length:1107 start_codon:yes stop_codon:yes gene_type:complete
MGGGSKSTSYSSTVPTWARKGHKEVIGHALKEYRKPWMPYVTEDGAPGQRIAGFSPQEMAAFEAASQMFGRGDPSEAFTNNTLGRASGVNVGRADSPFQGREFEFDRYVPQHDFGSITDQGNLDKYMSPYTSQVVDPQIREAQQQFNIQDQQSDAQRVSRGSRGGYREALQQAIERPERARQISEIRGTGQAKAYEDATSLFGDDRNMLVQQAQMHMKAFQDDQARLIEAQRWGDASEQAAAQFRLDAQKANIDASLGEIQRLSGLAKAGSDIGTAGQKNALLRLSALEGAGKTQRGLQQTQLQMDYDDWTAQNRDHPWEQIGRAGAALSGVPSNMVNSQTGPGQSLLGQLLGLGIMGSGMMQQGTGR